MYRVLAIVMFRTIDKEIELNKRHISVRIETIKCTGATRLLGPFKHIQTLSQIVSVKTRP